MLRVGLTGGLASGKSFVGRALADLGCLLIQADELGHQVLEPGGEAYDGAIQEFGPGIVNSDGTIDRRKLAAIVFHDGERLAKLNALVHPPVQARERQAMNQYAARLVTPSRIALTSRTARQSAAKLPRMPRK